MKLQIAVGLIVTLLSVEGFLIPLCPEGHRKSLNENCSSYLECVESSWQKKQCPYSYNFDKVTNSCREDFRCNVTCPDGQEYNDDKKRCESIVEREVLDAVDDELCDDESLSPVPGSCRQYYQCVNGKKVEKECWFFQRFDPEILSCDYMWMSSCDLGKECKTGDKIATGDCRQYFQCDYGYWKKRDCGMSIGLPMYFDSKSMDCMIVGSTCTSVECSVEGLKTDLPTDCSKYRVCRNGRFYEESCGWFQKFDVERNECRYVGVDCNREQDLPDCTGGSRVSVDGSCYSYRECVGGHFEKRFCFYPLYRYDKVSSSCVFMAECNEECYNKEVMPIPGKCDQYYLCNNGKYQIQTCSEGNAFDSVSMTCSDPTTATCAPS